MKPLLSRVGILLGCLAATALLITFIPHQASAGYLQGPSSWGSTANLTPPTFVCPNDGATGTGTNLVVKLSASFTCISTTTTDGNASASMAPVLGICISNCGTTGSAIIAASNPIFNCLFDTATTFGHWAVISASTAGNCSDNGSVAISSASNIALGNILDTGAAGVHAVELLGQRNPGTWLTFANGGASFDIGSAFSGQYRFRRNGGTAGICLQVGGSGNANPALIDSGALLQARSAGTNCTGTSTVALGVEHLSAMNIAAPTITSGFGSTPSIVSGGDTAFLVNVGTGGAATSGVVGFASAYTTAPACIVQDTTTNILTRCVATVSQVTLTGASAWTASDILAVHVFGQNGL